MKFCPSCQNCLSIAVETQDVERSGQVVQESVLKDKCRRCGYSGDRENLELENYKPSLDNSRITFNANEIVNDMTYPRTRVVECPNADCPRTRGESLYFREKGSIRAVYICCDCSALHSGAGVVSTKTESS